MNTSDPRPMAQREADMQAEIQANRDQIKRDLAKLIYAAACDMDDSLSLRMMREAESEEERRFYAYIHDMNLQRRQKIVIKNNVF